MSENVNTLFLGLAGIALDVALGVASRVAACEGRVNKKELWRAT